VGGFSPENSLAWFKKQTGLQIVFPDFHLILLAPPLQPAPPTIAVSTTAIVGKDSGISTTTTTQAQETSKKAFL